MDAASMRRVAAILRGMDFGVADARACFARLLLVLALPGTIVGCSGESGDGQPGDGRVFCWGLNYYGALGYVPSGTSCYRGMDCSLVPVPISVPAE